MTLNIPTWAKKYAKPAGVVALATALVAGAAFLRPIWAAQTTQTAAAAREETVRRGDLTVGITESGSATLENQVISYPVQVEVEELYVKAGQRVSAGEPLLKVDLSALQDEYGTLQASYDSALLKLEQAKQDQTTQSITAKYDYDSTRLGGETAELQYDYTVSEIAYNISDQSDKVDDLADKLADLYTDRQDLREERSDASSSYSSAREAYNAALADHQSAYPSGSWETLNTARARAKTAYEEAQAERDAAQAALEEAQAQEDEGSEEAIEAARQALEAAEAALETARAAMEEAAQAVADMEEAEKAVNAAKETMEKAKEEYSRLDSEYEKAQEDYSDTASNLSTARLKLDQLESQKEMDLLNAEADKEKSVAQSGNADTVYNATISQLASAVTAARATVNSTKKELDKVAEYLTDGVITAPVDGLVMSVNCAEGDAVSANTSLVVMATSTTYVMLSVSQDDIADLSLGMPVQLAFDAYEDETYTGAIDSISYSAARMGSTSVSYAVTILMDGSPKNIYEGMTCDATFITRQEKDCLYVSYRAVTTAADGTETVKRVDPATGESQAVPVTTGFSDGRSVQIISGLEEGDVVLIESRVNS